MPRAEPGLGERLLQDERESDAPRHASPAAEEEEQRAPPTWSDYRRLLTSRELLPVFFIGIFVPTIAALDDNLSLLISQAACHEEGVPTELCQHQDELSTSARWHEASLRITERAADLVSYSTTANQLCQMCTVLALGAAADRFGRKLVLQISLAGYVLDYLAIALVHDLDTLVVVHAAAGLLNPVLYRSMVVIIATDLTVPADRMLTMAVAHGIGFAAGATGPISVGTTIQLLTDRLGYLGALRGAFAIGSVIMLVTLVAVRFRLKESNAPQLEMTDAPQERGCSLGRKGNPVAMWQFLKETRRTSVIPTLVTLIFALNHFASGASVLVPLYAEQ